MNTDFHFSVVDENLSVLQALQISHVHTFSKLDKCSTMYDETFHLISSKILQKIFINANHKHNI